MPRLRQERDPFDEWRNAVTGSMYKRRVTLGELADACGVCPKTMSAYLREPKRMPYGVMLKIHRKLLILADDARSRLPMW